MAGRGCSRFCCGGSLVLGLLLGLVVSHPVRGSVGPWVRGSVGPWVRGSVGPWVRGSVGLVGVDQAIKGH